MSIQPFSSSHPSDSSIPTLPRDNSSTFSFTSPSDSVENLANKSPRLATGPFALSDEIALHVFSFLSKQELGRCAQVSRLFNSYAGDKLVWKELTLRVFKLFESGLPQNIEGWKGVYIVLEKIVHTFKNWQRTVAAPAAIQSSLFAIPDLQLSRHIRLKDKVLLELTGTVNQNSRHYYRLRDVNNQVIPTFPNFENYLHARTMGKCSDKFVLTEQDNVCFIDQQGQYNFQKAPKNVTVVLTDEALSNIVLKSANTVALFSQQMKGIAKLLTRDAQPYDMAVVKSNWFIYQSEGKIYIKNLLNGRLIASFDCPGEVAELVKENDSLAVLYYHNGEKHLKIYNVSIGAEKVFPNLIARGAFPPPSIPTDEEVPGAEEEGMELSQEDVLLGMYFIQGHVVLNFPNVIKVFDVAKTAIRQYIGSVKFCVGESLIIFRYETDQGAQWKIRDLKDKNWRCVLAFPQNDEPTSAKLIYQFLIIGTKLGKIKLFNQSGELVTEFDANPNKKILEIWAHNQGFATISDDVKDTVRSWKI